MHVEGPRARARYSKPALEISHIHDYVITNFLLLPTLPYSFALCRYLPPYCTVLY